MIAKLLGLLESVGEGRAVIDVGGVGYLVHCAPRTLSQLGPLGEAVTLVIDTHVREDHIHLYGFATETERDWFQLLQSVQGVGARMAQGGLSVLAPDELAAAIAAGSTMPAPLAPAQQQNSTMLTSMPWRSCKPRQAAATPRRS